MVTPSFPPSFGGLERHVEQHATAMQHTRCAVTVLTQMWDGTLTDAPTREVRPDGVEILRFRMPFGRKVFGFAPSLIAHLRRHQDDFDVVHLWSCQSSLAIASAMVLTRPFVVTPVFPDRGERSRTGVTHAGVRRLARRLFSGASTVVCGSPGEAVTLSAMFPEASAKIEILAPEEAQGVGLTAHPVGEGASSQEIADAPEAVLAQSDGPDRDGHTPPSAFFAERFLQIYRSVGGSETKDDDSRADDTLVP